MTPQHPSSGIRTLARFSESSAGIDRDSRKRPKFGSPEVSA